MNFKYLSFLFLLFLNLSYSQTLIKGNVKDNENNPVSSVSVVISNLEDVILTYGITDFDGNYTFSLQSDVEQIKLQINGFNYETITEILPNISQTKNYTLKPSTTELKEVIVKESVIKQKGDTISYNVASFATNKDRSIADIISKLPGVEVLSDGKILYQGKPINKYYIEGLDLLEGRYNLANKNLPYNQVSKIQILENHQPVKVLDSLVFSDNAALNIKLKRNVSFTGQAELGSGFEPYFYKANITPMLFSKTKQVIGSYQTNNIGENITNQTKVLTIDDLINDFEIISEKQNWLGIQMLNTPSFSNKRWLLNDSHIGSINFLQKLKNDYQFKMNVSYLNDSQKQFGNTISKFYTQNDTIELFERKQNNLFSNKLDLNLILEKNSKKNYVKNKFQFINIWDSQNGLLENYNFSILQRYSNHNFSVSNNYKNIFPLGKYLGTFQSFFTFNKSPEKLNVFPGQFSVLLNNNVDYDELEQKINLQTFFLNNALNFTKRINKVVITPKIGFLFENQKLNTNMFVNNSRLTQNEFKNELQRNKALFYLETKLEYKQNDWRFNIHLPLNSYFFEVKNFLNQKNENYLTFEPRISISKELNSFWKISALYKRSIQYGSLEKLYEGYILTDYRNIKKYNSNISTSINNNYSFGVNYRNPVKSLFGSVFYAFSKSKNNLIYSSNIGLNGASEIESFLIDNYRNSHNIYGRIDKYFSSLKTNVKLNTTFSEFNYEQLLNNSLTSISNIGLDSKLSIETEINNWFGIDLNTQMVFSVNKIQGNNNRKITNQLHGLNFNFYVNDFNYLALKSEIFLNDSFTKNISSEFIDILYRYTWKKKNIDFEFQLNNILNTKSYTTISVSDFSYIETNFNLRPRQFFFRIRFSL